LKHFLIILGILSLLFSCQPRTLKPVQTPAPKIRVLLSRITEPDSILLKGTYLLKSEEALYELGENNKVLRIAPAKKNYRLSTDNRSFTFNTYDKIILIPQDKKTSIIFRQKPYNGEFRLHFSEKLGVSLINRLDLEEYLKSVVPSEMPSARAGYFEALKAQAVCARTYAVGKMLERKNHLFDVYADHRDQVFKGPSAESAAGSRAVDQTRGDVLKYNDSLAVIFYHSTCGGISEDASEVWPDIKQPYLPQRKDLLGEEFSCAQSKYYRWKRRFNMAEIDSLMKINLGLSLLYQTVEDTSELVFEARVLKRSPSGRVQKIQLLYGDSIKVLENYQIRSFFRNRDGRGLPSLLFNIKSSRDSLIVFNGGGFGHGAGMCQWGALHMAESGYKFFDILVNKYFRGTYLEKVY